MRVLVVVGANIVGGAEMSLLRVLGSLPPDDDVGVAMVVPDPGVLEGRLRELGVDPIVLLVPRARHLGASAGALRRLVALASDADVVYAHDVRAAVYVQLVALMARRPWVFRIHDLMTGAHRFQHAVRLTRPTRLVANSEAVRDQAVRFGRWRRSSVDLVYHGVDAADLQRQGDRAAFRSELGATDEEVLVGIVGRFEPRKGFADFIRAAALVAPGHPVARFVVVGDVMGDAVTLRQLGDLRSEWEQLARSLGLGDRITFTGARSDIASVMAGLDVFVMASRDEPLGIVVLEALSLGRAVVCTDQGGTREIVEGDRTALLVPPSDPEAMADAVSRLIADPDLRRRLGEAGRASVAQRFSIEAEAAGLRQAWAVAANDR